MVHCETSNRSGKSVPIGQYDHKVPCELAVVELLLGNDELRIWEKAHVRHDLSYRHRARLNRRHNHGCVCRMLLYQGPFTHYVGTLGTYLIEASVQVTVQ